jgi:hypothetical protein
MSHIVRTSDVTRSAIVTYQIDEGGLKHKAKHDYMVAAMPQVQYNPNRIGCNLNMLTSIAMMRSMSNRSQQLSQ